nr:PAS domain-containing protein [Amycolatopsis anabasis]
MPSVATKAQESLARHHEYDEIFGSLFTHSGMPMAILDPGLRIQEANAELLRLLGRSAIQVRGRSLETLLHPAAQQHVRRRFVQLAEGRSGHFTVRAVLSRSPESAFPAQLTAVAVQSDRRITTVVVLVKPDEDEQVPGAGAADTTLSALDARILEGVAAGIPTTQLASKLYLSRQGVEYHVSAMLRKFSVPNRAALVSKAYSIGMFKIGSWPPKILVQTAR